MMRPNLGRPNGGTEVCATRDGRPEDGVRGRKTLSSSLFAVAPRKNLGMVGGTGLEPVASCL